MKHNIEKYAIIDADNGSSNKIQEIEFPDIDFSEASVNNFFLANPEIKAEVDGDYVKSTRKA